MPTQERAQIDRRRRQFLTLCSTSLLVGVTGCLGDSDSAGERGDESIGPSLEEATTSEGSFAMTGSFEEQGLEIDLESRHDDGDTYWEVTQPGMHFELYVVDGESYQRIDGECVRTAEADGDGMDAESEPAIVDPDVVGNDPESDQRYPVDRETINDTDVFVYAVPIDGEGTETGTVYVESDTGYLRRLEYEQGSLEFHSWGAVEPVELPADCRSV